MPKLIIIPLLIIALTSSCQGQDYTGPCQNERLFIEWRESVLSQIDTLAPSFSKDLHNFFVGFSQLRYSAFSGMLDTLKKYDFDSLVNFYIVFYCNIREHGEQLILRTYNDKNIGYDLRSYDHSEFEEIAFKSYSFDKNAFDEIYDKMPMRINPFHVFSISVFKSGHFETKIFSVNNIEEGHMMDKFIPYIGG